METNKLGRILAACMGVEFNLLNNDQQDYYDRAAEMFLEDVQSLREAVESGEHESVDSWFDRSGVSTMYVVQCSCGYEARGYGLGRTATNLERLAEAEFDKHVQGV